MSHIETVETVITDLVALKAACERLGVEFREGQKTYAWYGRSMSDYPLPSGLTVQDLGKCDHAIRVPDVAYEVGVVPRKGEPGYMLAYDFWGPGEGLQRKFCKSTNGRYTTGMEHLVNSYSTEVLKRRAAAKGYKCEERIRNGKTQLIVTY